MTVELRIAMIALAAFAATGLLASCLVPLVDLRPAAAPAAVRARRLAALRLLPATVAFAVAVTVTAAFVLFEPRESGERFGLLLPALATLALIIIATSCGRWIFLARATRRAVRQWLATAEPISLPGISAPAFAVTSDFPIVAVIGWRRPRLIIARSVLASCSPDELRAVLAHEQGHIDRRDNMRRLLLSITPDVLAWLPSSERLFTDWRDAAEEAADDDAARSGEHGRLRLASALIKVARLAPQAPQQAVMPASALYRGESLDRRVRRLLDDDIRSVTPPSPWRGRLAIAVCLVLTPSALDTIHGVVEAVIHRLP